MSRFRDETKRTMIENSETVLTPTEKAILNHVWRHPECSRAEVSQQMGLSKAMLTKAVGRFIDERLVAEDREDRLPSGRGQPAIRLRLVPKARLGVGVSLSTRGLGLAVSDLACQIVATASHPPLDTHEPEQTAGRVVDEIRRLLAAPAVPDAPLAGVGISLPGLVSSDDEIQEISPSQRSIPFEAVKTAICTAFGKPVYFENQALAYHDAIQPTNQYNVLLYVTLDHGVGGGLIDHGRIFRGGFNQAVNIGGLLPEPQPRPSVIDLARALGEPEPDVTEARLEQMMAAGDTRLLTWINQRAPLLSMPLSIAVQLFNPDVIVLGGLFPKSVYAAMIDRIDLSLCDVPGRLPLTKPELRVATLTGGHAPASAAAAVPIARLFLDSSRARRNGRAT